MSSHTSNKRTGNDSDEVQPSLPKRAAVAVAAPGLAPTAAASLFAVSAPGAAVGPFAPAPTAHPFAPGPVRRVMTAYDAQRAHAAMAHTVETLRRQGPAAPVQTRVHHAAALEAAAAGGGAGYFKVNDAARVLLRVFSKFMYCSLLDKDGTVVLNRMDKVLNLYAPFYMNSSESWRHVILAAQAGVGNVSHLQTNGTLQVHNDPARTTPLPAYLPSMPIALSLQTPLHDLDELVHAWMRAFFRTSYAYKLTLSVRIRAVLASDGMPNSTAMNWVGTERRRVTSANAQAVLRSVEARTKSVTFETFRPHGIFSRIIVLRHADGSLAELTYTEVGHVPADELGPLQTHARSKTLSSVLRQVVVGTNITFYAPDPIYLGPYSFGAKGEYGALVRAAGRLATVFAPAGQHEPISRTVHVDTAVVIPFNVLDEPVDADWSLANSPLMHHIVNCIKGV